MSQQAYAVVTGGGTSGHVLPALAVADALVDAGHDAASIRYVGAERGIETRLLPETPYPHTFLDVVGAQRRLTRANLGFVPKMVRSTRTATRLLREWQPRVVVSVGGYASMPAVFAARRLGIPLVVVSYDRTPGRASWLSARFAAACAVAATPRRVDGCAGAPGDLRRRPVGRRPAYSGESGARSRPATIRDRRDGRLTGFGRAQRRDRLVRANTP